MRAAAGAACVAVDDAQGRRLGVATRPGRRLRPGAAPAPLGVAGAARSRVARRARRAFAVATAAACRCDRAPPRLARVAARAGAARGSAAPCCAPARQLLQQPRALDTARRRRAPPAQQARSQRLTHRGRALLHDDDLLAVVVCAAQASAQSHAAHATLRERTNAVQDEAVGALALDVQEGGHAAVVDGHAGAGARHRSRSAEKMAICTRDFERCRALTHAQRCTWMRWQCMHAAGASFRAHHRFS